MKKIIVIMAIAVVFVFAFMAGSSQASFSGSVYVGDSTAAANPALGPQIAATSTFTVDKLDFDTRLGGGTYTTYDLFLGGVGNVNNLVWTGTPQVGNIATSGGAGTFFQFTGTAYFPANIMITHDDGFYLLLGNTPYDYSTPTVPIDTAIGNAAGTYNFVLNYGAWNGFPEVLKVPTTNAPVPIPAAVWLFGTGLLGLVGVRRKIKK